MLTKNGTEQNLSSPKKRSGEGPPKPKHPAKSFVSNLGILAGALLIAAALMAAAYFFKRSLQPNSEPIAARLSASISRDLNALKQQNALPQAFGEISNFDLTSESSAFKPWIDDLKINFPVNGNGRYTLELFIFFFVDGNKIGANVQYDLVESKSKNTVWELTRSYPLGSVH